MYYGYIVSLVSWGQEINHSSHARNDYQDKHYQENVLLFGFLLQSGGLVQLFIGVHKIFVCVHQFIRNDVQILSLFFDFYSHIINDIVDALSFLLYLVNQLIFFQHHFALSIVVNLDLVLFFVWISEDWIFFISIVLVSVCA